MAAGIVCGVDGSTNAGEAAVVARRLSDRLALGLELVHVGPPGELGSITRLVDAPVRRLEGPPAARIVEGPPGPRLVELARSERAALLATGAPSHGVLMSALLGSPARHPLRHAPRPVLVCRSGAPGAAGLGRLSFARWVHA